MKETTTSQRPRPRKMPRQGRSAETVRAIIEAAARILERDGLGAFTTNAVAERAGVSIGSLYQYFPGKEALIGALIVRETSLLIAECEAAVAGVSGREALKGIIVAAVIHQLRRPALARLLDLEEARLPFDEDTRRVTDRLRLILLSVLVRADLPTQLDPDVAAQDVLAIIKGMVDAAGERGEQDRDALGSRVGRAVYGYLDNAA
ncbi:TetR/AcrR family transcriptional regulator [Sphingomonas sp. S6]|jgi:AcrR family transcriptional regulator|uniref:TetR/AcrR family transcriptional regulator n=1 Tax=Sphingomonas sp. S6 TaxID=3368600 RepID=UPI000F923DC1|nr:TetR/AcrR family transcriptional regulator [uncultured Sphingomonas sp.]RTL15655.1 MAG: TetR/AcrR family transcriptional regulator [Sphingomonadaceae bacterium]